jgi:starvation-inducible outer membrane lipoprotein
VYSIFLALVLVLSACVTLPKANAQYYTLQLALVIDGSGSIT